MRLEFFLENVHEIAPLLSKLYADVLAKGHMTPSMCHAILSPIYKNSGVCLLCGYRWFIL